MARVDSRLTDPSPVASPDVTRARTGTLVLFAAAGMLLASWLSRTPDVKRILDLTPGELGLLLLFVSAGAVTSLPMAGRITHRIGAVNAVRLGAILLLPGMACYALAVEFGAPRGVAMLGLFLFGFGTGIWDVAQNLEGTIVEQALGRSTMPWFHAAFSGATVLGALVGAVMVWLGVPIAAHVIGACVVVAACMQWATARFMPRSAEAAHDEHAHHDEATAGSAARPRSAWLEPRTLLIGLMVLAASFTEGTANDWLAVAFVDGHDLEPALGVLALGVFMAFMTAGRVFGAGVLDRYGRVPVLRVLFGAAFVGCVLVVFGSPAIAFVGAAIWGVGSSLGFPVGMSAAADDPRRAALRISVVSTIGYTAFLAGPPLVGFLGDHVGILNALLAVGAASALAIVIAPVARPLPRP